MPERPGNDTAIFAIVGITSGMKAYYVALYDLYERPWAPGHAGAAAAWP